MELGRACGACCRDLGVCRETAETEASEAVPGPMPCYGDYKQTSKEAACASGKLSTLVDVMGIGMNATGHRSCNVCRRGKGTELLMSMGQGC